MFVEAAVDGDASCRICPGVAFIFSQADVKSPAALAGVGGSEDAVFRHVSLVSSNSFHCDITNNGPGFPSS